MARVALATKTTPQKKGQWAEQLACRHLKTQGLALVETNFHERCGEIDLIMKDQSVLVFVEVRLRSSQAFGGGIESITEAKQKKIVKTATLYLQKHHLLDKIPCRFDVVCVEPSVINPSQPDILWIKNAFN